MSGGSMGCVRTHRWVSLSSLYVPLLVTVPIFVFGVLATLDVWWVGMALIVGGATALGRILTMGCEVHRCSNGRVLVVRQFWATRRLPLEEIENLGFGRLWPDSWVEAGWRRILPGIGSEMNPELPVVTLVSGERRRLTPLQEPTCFGTTRWVRKVIELTEELGLERSGRRRTV